jgi:preprotein translocase subunit YajC
MKSLWIIAQGGANEPSPPSKIVATPAGQEQTSTSQPAAAVKDVNAPGPQKTRGFDPMTLIFLGLLLVFMYFILFRGPKKREQEHHKMIQSLKKNDKVRTIGGIIGVIVDVKDDEITLKVDESTNTKIKVLPSAIGKNLTDEKGK